MLPALRFRIQKSPDQCLFASFPELIAGCRVFLRLSMPRHPPYTLGKLDLLDRGSIRVNQSSHAKGLLRQQVLERCPLRRKDHENDLSKAGIAEVTYSY